MSNARRCTPEARSMAAQSLAKRYHFEIRA
jgi:hypothetical protein